MSKARRPAAQTTPHEALLRLPMDGLHADVARLPLRVVRALFDRDRDGLFVLLICVVLFRAACFFYLLTQVVVTTLFPVLLLAGCPAVARLAAAAFFPQVSGSVAQTAHCVRIIL